MTLKCIDCGEIESVHPIEDSDQFSHDGCRTFIPPTTEESFTITYDDMSNFTFIPDGTTVYVRYWDASARRYRVRKRRAKHVFDRLGDISTDVSFVKPKA